VGNIHQPSRAKLDTAEPLTVRVECRVVIHSRGQVAEVCGRQRLARGSFEVHHIDGFLRIGERVGNLLRAKQRTGRQKRQELSAVMKLIAVHRA